MKIFRRRKPIGITPLETALHRGRSVKTLANKIRLKPNRTKSKVDILWRLQIFNGSLDLILKFGALSLVLGAGVIYKYLVNLEAKSLFPQIIGSQAGLSAAIFGLGLVIITVFLMLVISPSVLRFCRNSLPAISSGILFSEQNVRGIMIAPQIVLLGATLIFEEGWQLIGVFSMVTLLSYLSLRENVRRLTPEQHAILLAAIFLGQIFTIFPWIFLIPIGQSLSKAAPSWLNEDASFFFVFLIWVGLYSLVSAIFVSSGETTKKENWKTFFTQLAGLFLCVFYFLLWIPGDFFVNAAMKSTGMRQAQNESQWWSLKTEAAEMFAPDASPKTFKHRGGNTYFCGYSPLLNPERVMLCPAKVAEPSMKNCFVFLGSQVMPISRPQAIGWDCPKLGNP